MFAFVVHQLLHGLLTSLISKMFPTLWEISSMEDIDIPIWYSYCTVIFYIMFYEGRSFFKHVIDINEGAYYIKHKYGRWKKIVHVWLITEHADAVGADCVSNDADEHELAFTNKVKMKACVEHSMSRLSDQMMSSPRSLQLPTLLPACHQPILIGKALDKRNAASPLVPLAP